MNASEFRTYPCQECPWRRDADLSQFSDDDMARLRAANAGVADRQMCEAEVRRMAAAPQMACHRDQPGTAHPMRVCAGWLAVVGPEHVPTRMALISGQLPAEAVYPDTSTWPALHASLRELLTSRQQHQPPTTP